MLMFRNLDIETLLEIVFWDLEVKGESSEVIIWLI